jgi:hypothetical protein
MIPRILEIEKIEFAENTLRTRTLPRSLMRGLILQLDLEVTNGSSASANIFKLCNVIKKISLVINGQDTRISVPFYHLFYSNTYDFGTTPRYSISSAAGSGTDRVNVVLPFALPRSVLPDDTLLDLRNVSSATLEVTFGAKTYGTNKTIDNGSLKIYSMEYAQAGEFSPIAIHEMSYTNRAIAAEGEIDIDLDYGGANQYRSLYVYTFNNSGALTGGLFSNFKVKSRTFTYIDIDTNILIGNNQIRYNKDNVPTGVYIIDFTNGRMSERLDARGLNELKFIPTSATTNPTEILIVKDKAIY